ncbi:MAG: hypothetical protein L6Q84_31545 [Polyangiaceae bacterium]|nr:hypothetical protein [Polyangiaceae bacterium]
MNLEVVLEDFLAATSDVRGEDPRLSELAPRLLQLSKRQPRATLDHALRRLLSAVNARHPQVAGFVALMGGCLVEEGADPDVLVKALVPRVNEALTVAARACEAVAGLAEADEEDEREATLTIGDRLISAREWEAFVDKDPSSAQSLLALDNFCQALIAALTRLPDTLKSSAVQALAVPLVQVSHASHFAHFLSRLLRVPMNEEWFIIDPKARRGFALEVSGVANAFQVYALVHAALCGAPNSLTHWAPPVPRPAPPAAVLDVANGRGPQEAPGSYVPPFTLFRWTVITEVGRLPGSGDYREWYSNSAVPAELARFGDARIGVLGHLGINMELGIAREFSALAASVKLTRELQRRHVVELLHGFSSTPGPGHPVPGVGWP